jgi:uncharacterized membrane protein YjgN (DUF898 family)
MTALALLPPPAPPPIRAARAVTPPILPPPIPLRLGAIGCFTGRPQAFRRIMLRGALLRVATLGIYRFWHTTDTRHFLWANTEIGGDSLEYSGTARELFLGCLMVIALLAPASALVWVLGSAIEFRVVAQLSSAGALVLLGVLGPYAAFRARRYRLTRTAFRGISFHQSGSAFAYALRSLLWGVLTALTLGLAYPWARASLERYKLAHTHYGSWGGRFAGSGTQLFVRGIGLWLMLMAAAVACAIVVSQSVDPDALRRAGHLATDDEAAFAAGLVMLLGLGVMLLAGIAYPLLQAIVMRWWLEGLRIGPLAVATTLRKRTIIGAYLRCFLYATLLVIVVSIAVSLAVDNAPALEMPEDVDQLVMTGVGVVAYLVTVLGVWVLHQATVKLRIWRLAVDSISIAGFEAITNERTDTRTDARLPGSAVGEGIADALAATRI